MCFVPPPAFLRSLSLLLAVGLFTASLGNSALFAADGKKKAKAKPAPAKDLRPEFEQYGLTARAQGERPTCSVFTMTGAIEFALARQGHKSPRLSVDYLNWASNQANGKPRDGSLFSDLWKGFEMYGQCPEKDMPYRPEFDPKREPSKELQAKGKQLRKAGLHMRWIKRWDPTKGLNERQFQRIKRVLHRGYPVCGGFLWPKKGLKTWDKDGLLAMYPRKDMRDGHSIILIGYRDDPKQPGGGVFLIRNSGKGVRHGAITYEYAKTYMNDAVWVGPQKKGKKAKRARVAQRMRDKASETPASGK